jgi:hypothetical protein
VYGSLLQSTAYNSFFSHIVALLQNTLPAFNCGIISIFSLPVGVYSINSNLRCISPSEHMTEI